MFWIMKAEIWVTCIIIFLGYEAFAAPLDSDKSGEEQVKDAVRKAEAAASLAAEDSIAHGHKAEARVSEEKVNRLASEVEDDSSMKEGHAAKKVNLMMKHLDKKESDSDDESEHTAMKRIKEHRVHRKPSLSHLMGMAELGDVSSNTNAYKEDTKLEDRLALEAEEEKKYEDGYGGQGWDDGPAGNSKGSWSTNIQKQDAAEKQSIQAQVASESAHELNEIQQAVASESQSSRGSATMGDQGATVVQVGGNSNEGQGARFREEEAQRPMETGASYEVPRIKSFESNGHQQNVLAGLDSPSMPYRQADLSSIIRQASKLSPSEMQGPPKQFSSEGMGSLNGLSLDSNGGQGLSRFTQSESMGQQEVSPMMSNAFTGGAEGTQMSTGSYQDSEPSQRDSRFTAGGGLQGVAGVEVSNMQGGAPLEFGGNSMGSLSAGYGGAQQQQPLMVGGQAGAAMMGGMQSMQAQPAGASMGGLPQSYGSMGGMQSFGGAAGMGFKKSTIERPDDQQEIKDSESRKRRSKESST
ncbi:uncharacterized protein LOC116294696 isoform X4 [Actinia tenebrosa]|uniref:Uncharacterized protein LOC116294696 isoform X4 n=1 Tax=Actinia tenebrosa TaxID=6105 RepID=A0A6P8HZV8_ACTTE|nr:uncharacterized protein LOC116294696 isoform X4 [Actinia tenebrosa]